MQDKNDLMALAYDSDECPSTTSEGQAMRKWYEARMTLLDAVMWLEEHEEDSVESAWLVEQTSNRLRQAIAHLALAAADLDAL